MLCIFHPFGGRAKVTKTSETTKNACFIFRKGSKSDFTVADGLPGDDGFDAVALDVALLVEGG